jgi:hypothetical protein
MAKDEAYKQAEQKIQQALQSGATELDLRSMKLTEFLNNRSTKAIAQT